MDTFTVIEPPADMPSEPRAWAAFWAHCGLNVFPVRSDGTKAPHLINWFNLATRDPHEIRSNYWNKWPHAWVGAVPGRSGCLVLDLDVKHDRDGISELARLQERYGPLPATFACRSPSGGKHLWLTGNVPTSNNGRVGDGIDVRSNRPDGSGAGLIIMPSGANGYSVECAAPVAPAPAWLIELTDFDVCSTTPPIGEAPRPPGTFRPLPSELLADWFRERRISDRSAEMLWIWRQFWNHAYTAEQAVESVEPFDGRGPLGHYADHPLGYDAAITRDVARCYAKFAGGR